MADPIGIAIVGTVYGADVTIDEGISVQTFSMVSSPDWWYHACDVHNVHLQIEVKAAGYEPYRVSVDIPAGGCQIRIGYPQVGDPPTINLPGLVKTQPKPPDPPKPGTLPPLIVRGNDFVDAAGKRIVLNGIDGFCDFGLFLAGRLGELDNQYRQAVELGFNVRRVWSQGSASQNGVLELNPATTPEYYFKVSEFQRWANDRGIIPLMTCFIDNQVVQSPIGHWSAMCNAMNPSTGLCSGFNQWSKNASNFGPQDLPAPKAGIIWSRGSDVDDVMTPQNGATFSELHSTRVSNSRSLMDATASPPYMQSHGATVCAMTEGIPFDSNSEPLWGWNFGAGYRILWGLAVFHNRQSQRGEMLSEGTAKCGAAWTNAIRL